MEMLLQSDILSIEINKYMNDNLRALLTGIMIFWVGGLFADNLSVGSVLLTPGQSKVVTIQLNNQTASYTAFQFDMVLPDGVQVVKSVGDDLLASLSVERISDHELHAAMIKSNIYRFLAFSMTNADFSGKNGALLHITLSADKDMNNVNESLKVMSQEFVEADGTQHILEDQTFPLSVFSGELTPITIGKGGKASYCGDQSLDFSFSNEIKAYIATGFDETEGTIWLTRVKDVPANTPVLIKGVAEKTYNVPVTDSQNSYYKNMFKGNTSGATIQINETEDGFVNYYLSGDGTFKSVKNYANIGNNKSYLQLPDTFNPATAGETQKVTVGASGKASYAAPVDLDFTNVEGLKAFTATGYDKSSKTIWLTRVMKVQKGEGLLLKGEAKEYQIPSVAVQSSYGNMFVGNTSGNEIQVKETSDDGSLTNFYLKGDGTFVSVKGYVNIKNNKCYLALPTEMVVTAASTRSEASYLLEEPEVIKLPILFRSLDNDANGTTGINVQSSVVNGQSKDAYYTLQGQRVDNPGKGIYIKNGKKVVIK